MRFDRVLTHVHARGDLLVGKSFGDQRQNLQFARRDTERRTLFLITHEFDRRFHHHLAHHHGLGVARGSREPRES